MTDFPEIAELQSWLGNVHRHPSQTNLLNQSDCEMVRLGPNFYLASTIDSISEEIAVGLYRDPYTMGWIAATASLSDLAAVGAEPIGILFSAQFAADFDLFAKRRCSRGLKDAIAKAGTHLLGGDSGHAVATLLTATGLGKCRGKPLSRVGAKSGDLLCTTGAVGIGPALGFDYLLRKARKPSRSSRGLSSRSDGPGSLLRESHYRPIARIREGLALRSLASSCIDTSDGFAQALHTLSKINGVGFELNWQKDWIALRARKFCVAAGLPLTSLLFGEHGDFELLLTLPSAHLVNAKRLVPALRVLGKATSAKRGVMMKTRRGVVPMKVESSFHLPRRSRKDLHRVFDFTVSYLVNLGLP